MNHINSFRLSTLDLETSEAVPGEVRDIFSVCAVGDEFILLIAFIKLHSPVAVRTGKHLSIVHLDFLSLFGAFENRISGGVFARIIEPDAVFLRNENGLEASDDSVGGSSLNTVFGFGSGNDIAFGKILFFRNKAVIVLFAEIEII